MICSTVPWANSTRLAGQVPAGAGSAHPTVGPDVMPAAGKHVSVPMDEAYVDDDLVTTPVCHVFPYSLVAFT